MAMDISMDIQAKSVDMDGKFHIHGNPAYCSVSASIGPTLTDVAHYVIHRIFHQHNT